MTEPQKPTNQQSALVRANFFNKYKICAAPIVKEDHIKDHIEQKDTSKSIDLSKDVPFDRYPTYSELQLAKTREQNELVAKGKSMKKNTLNGFYESANFNETQFEEQRRSYQFKGHAASTSDKPNAPSILRPAEVEKMLATNNQLQISSNSKRLKNDDATDLDGYLGPWAGYSEEKLSHKPNQEDALIINQYLEKRNLKKRRKPGTASVEVTGDEQTVEYTEKFHLHIKDPYDYQGRSFLVAPRDLDGVNLYKEDHPNNCQIPRHHLHTYTGHSKAITAIKYFPKTAHLLLSSSIDKKIKLWEVYKGRRNIITYSGHTLGVRDVGFNIDGTKFISASYDKYVKLWDTETGACINRFTNNSIIQCVKFNPDPEFSHLFLAGMSNKKIICWDTRTGELVQEYDRHLGAVNSIVFVDENRKFISTSDDKSIRVWEWDIPVDVKYIADPVLHSMPAVTSSLNNKYLLCQSMDNKIHAFTCHNNKFKLDNKKIFKGHMVAGYACVPDFSCDMSLVVSGDAEGKVFFWSWNKPEKVITSFKAHDNACISAMWHPHENQKLITAGWDSTIKIWG